MRMRDVVHLIEKTRAAVKKNTKFLYSAVSSHYTCSKRSTLHPLPDLFTPRPFQLLWEAFTLPSQSLWEAFTLPSLSLLPGTHLYS